jgi:hypothetical protein
MWKWPFCGVRNLRDDYQTPIRSPAGKRKFILEEWAEDSAYLNELDLK